MSRDPLSDSGNELSPQELRTLGDRLRWTIEVQMGMKQAAFARKMEVTPQMLSRWVMNRMEPSEENLQKISELTGVAIPWLRYGQSEVMSSEGEEKARRWLSEGSHRVVPMIVRERRPAPAGETADWGTLSLPDTSFLHAKAQDVFDAAIGSYVRRGWTSGNIERAAVLLVGYFSRTSLLQSSGASLPNLSADQQIQILEESKKEIEYVFGERGRG